MSRDTRKTTMELSYAALMMMTPSVPLGELGKSVENEVGVDEVVGEGGRVGKMGVRYSLGFEKCPKGVSGRLSSACRGRDNERGSASESESISPG